MWGHARAAHGWRGRWAMRVKASGGSQSPQVCVPIDPDKVDDFDPRRVPTIGRLVDELNAGADVRSTSLRAYTHFWEEAFLQPLEKELVEELSRGSLDW